MSWSSPKAPFSDNYHYWLVWHFPGNTQTRLVFTWPQSLLLWTASSMKAFVKNNQRQLFNIAAAWGSNKNLSKQIFASWQKTLKGKGEKWDVHWGFWKSLTCFWESESLYRCTRLGCEHTQERIDKTLNSHCWLTLGFAQVRGER